jgi:hypothetical protein
MSTILPNDNDPNRSLGAAVWPPPPAEAATSADAMEIQNTSGTNGPLPPEIARLKWNWGAFGSNIFWLFAHRVYAGGTLIIAAFVAITVLIFTNKPMQVFNYASLPFWGVYVYLGFAGHRLAWRKRRFKSLQHFFAVETIWRNVTIALFVVWAAFMLVVTVVQAIKYYSYHPGMLTNTTPWQRY